MVAEGYWYIYIYILHFNKKPEPAVKKTPKEHTKKRNQQFFFGEQNSHHKTGGA